MCVCVCVCARMHAYVCGGVFHVELKIIVGSKPVPVESNKCSVMSEKPQVFFSIR